jgi:hypothetical protein
MKICQAVQKLLVGDTQTDTQTQAGDLISLLSFFLKYLGHKSESYGCSESMCGIGSQIVSSAKVLNLQITLRYRSD